MADILTFGNIVSELQRALKKGKGSIDDLIKMTVNMVYLNEIISCDSLNPLYWLVDFDDTLASVAPLEISAVTKADPGVMTVKVTPTIVAGDIFMVHNIAGMTELNGRMFSAGTVNTGNKTIGLKDIDGTDIVTTNYTTWSSGGTINHHGLTLATTGKDVKTIIVPRWVGEKKMTPIGVKELEESFSLMGDNTAGNPTRYMQRKAFTEAGVETNQLIWYPGAGEAKDLRYWFEKRVPKLVEDADVPMLPYDFHHSLIAGTMVRLKEYDAQVENPISWGRIYMSHLRDIRTYNRKHYKKEQNEHYKLPFMI